VETLAQEGKPHFDSLQGFAHVGGGSFLERGHSTPVDLRGKQCLSSSIDFQEFGLSYGHIDFSQFSSQDKVISFRCGVEWARLGNYNLVVDPIVPKLDQNTQASFIT
jgi:hypothetical protein